MSPQPVFSSMRDDSSHLPRLERPAPWRQALAAGFAALATLTASTAWAEPMLVTYAGQGSFDVIDNTTGQVRWSGQLDGFQNGQGQALPLTTLVSFTIDASTLQLGGQFTFSSLDGLSTLFGSVSGSADSADVFDQGGQIELDYAVEGGSGALGAFTGFGLAFVQLTPGSNTQRALDANAVLGSTGRFDEAGLFVLDGAVPEPASFGLAGLALLGLGAARRRQAGQSPC